MMDLQQVDDGSNEPVQLLSHEQMQSFDDRQIGMLLSKHKYNNLLMNSFAEESNKDMKPFL